LGRERLELDILRGRGRGKEKRDEGRDYAALHDDLRARARSLER
jgi:hypothetical protein